MSCTVVALPVLLFQVVGALVASTAVTAGVTGAISSTIDAADEFNEIPEINQDTKDIANICEDVKTLTVSDIVEKDFETPFMDKEVLLKTMEEHGITSIEESYDGKITGRLDNFGFLFEKPSQDLPYHVRITCNQNDNAEEKVGDLSSEYALNVQEAAYLSIVEKLKDNNMEVESETVEDDNTIVLTVNLE